MRLNLLRPRQIPKAAANLDRNTLGYPTGPDEFRVRKKDGTAVSLEIGTFPVKIGIDPLRIQPRSWSDGQLAPIVGDKGVGLPPDLDMQDS